MKRYNVTAIAPNRTLASGIDSGAGSLDLDSAPAGAPTVPFQIAVWEEQGDGSYSRSEMEVMEVTAISGATLTIGERGMEGTSARSFSSGALVTIGLWTPSQLEHAIGFEEDAGQQSGTYEWDVDASPHLRIELTGDLTINTTGIRNGRRVVLLLIQDSTGGHSLTLGDGFATANGEQLDISTDAGAISALGGFTSGGAVIIDVGKSEAPSGELQVQTDAATGLDAGTATLNGELIALPDGETAQASFEYRKTSGGVWILTDEQTLNDPATYSDSLTGLDEEEHEFRARAESAGMIEIGSPVLFTPSSTTTSSEIQSYIDAVNVQRSTDLSAQAVSDLQEFWDRLGNSQGELSGDLTASLVGIYPLSGKYNVDQGSHVKGIVGPDLEVGGEANFGFDSDGYEFMEGGWLFIESNLVNTVDQTHLAHVIVHRGTDSVEAIVSQRQDGNYFSPIRQQTTSGNPVGALNWDGSNSTSATVTGYNDDTVYAGRINGDAEMSIRNIETDEQDMVDSSDGVVWPSDSPPETSYSIGNDVGLDRPFDGKLGFAIAFEVELSTSDVDSIASIYRSTINPAAV